MPNNSNDIFPSEVKMARVISKKWKSMFHITESFLPIELKNLDLTQILEDPKDLCSLPNNQKQSTVNELAAFANLQQLE